MTDLNEDRDERRMFNEAVEQYGGNSLRQMAGALTIWHKMAPKQGSYGKVLAIYANECAKAANKYDELFQDNESLRATQEQAIYDRDLAWRRIDILSTALADIRGDWTGNEKRREIARTALAKATVL